MNKWTAEETNLLTEYYPKKGAQYCSGMLERSLRSISSKAFMLNLKCDFHPYWNKGI